MHRNRLSGTLPLGYSLQLFIERKFHLGLTARALRSAERVPRATNLIALLLDNNALRGDMSVLDDYCHDVEFLQVANQLAERHYRGMDTPRRVLTQLHIDGNSISTLPMLSNFSMLTEFLRIEQDQGTVPDLPANISVLALHQNRLTGTLSRIFFASQTLSVATIHDNLIKRLLSNFESYNASRIFVHNNKLSCKVPSIPNPSSATGTVLLGNQMRARGPQ